MHNLVMNMQFNPPKTYFVSGNILGYIYNYSYLLHTLYSLTSISLNVYL